MEAMDVIERIGDRLGKLDEACAKQGWSIVKYICGNWVVMVDADMSTQADVTADTGEYIDGSLPLDKLIERFRLALADLE